jgi:hypothetical protein
MPAPKKSVSPLPEKADELAALLHELSLHDDASELRRFCKEYGIRRNQRAGRRPSSRR